MEDGANKQFEGGQESLLVLTPACASQGPEDPQTTPSTLSNTSDMRGEGEVRVQCHPKDRGCADVQQGVGPQRTPGSRFDWWVSG